MTKRVDRGAESAPAQLAAALTETLPGASDAARAATVDSARGAAVAAPVAPRRGAMIDHFVVIDELGAGGMGVVVAAYDTELDRKVAIKLLRADGSRAGDAAGARTRLMREAQALAKLSHPNVVTVYEVATFDERVAIVMEYVHGQTLTAWLAERKRSWREVVDVFQRAGEGLAAAHRAGLVHRDFKPDNVLVGRDGRVRVTDFGLVSTTATAVGSSSGDDHGRPVLTASAPLSVTVTYGGALVGTPAYMAPEQVKPRNTDGKSDQFSFCVALYEGLYGERPFAGKSYLELRDAVHAGTVREPPRDADVPSWVRALVLRGLRANPGERHASMDALLQELRRDPGDRRRRLAVIGAVIGLAAIAAVGLYRGGTAPVEPCAGARERMRGVWDADVRARVERAFADTARAYAGETFALVAERFDRRADAWVEARTEACRATRVRGEQSERLLDLRMACLDRRLGEMRALTALLAREPDAELLGKATKAVSSLTPLDACADTEALISAVPLPDEPALRQRVAEVRARLDEIAAMREAGQYPAAIELAVEVAEQTGELAYPPVRAEALHLLGRLLAAAGEPKRAEAVLYDALRASSLARDHRRVAETWIQLIHLIGARDARYDEALDLRVPAEVAVAQAGGVDAQRALLFDSLGLVLAAKGEFDAARELHQRALELFERRFGAEHPRVALTLSNLANTFAEQGRYAEARPHYERALQSQEQLLGAHHPDIAMTLNNLANIVSFQGDNALAVRHYERALAIWEDSLTPNHPLIATCLNNLGSAASAMRDTTAAAAYYERALAMLEATFGAAHPAAGTVLGNLGENDVDRGDLDRALERCGRALGVMEAALGPDNIDLAYALTCVGRAYIGKQQARRARAPLERALTLREANAGDALDLAETRFALAQALWYGGGDRRRAGALALEAQASFAEAGAHRRSELEQVTQALDSWGRR